MLEVGKIGDYVTASLVGRDDSRQGVYFKDLPDGNILVRGEGEDYICLPNPTRVPDENVFVLSTKEHIASVREIIERVASPRAFLNQGT